MTKNFILMAFALFIAGCTAYPKELRIEKVGMAVIPTSDMGGKQGYHESMKTDAPILEVTFSARAPFAYLYSNGYQSKVRCHVYETDGGSKIIGEGLGHVYFDGLIDPPDTSIPYDTLGGDMFRYVLYTFRQLRAWPSDSGPGYIDLISSDYSHVECGIWGFVMLPIFKRSNTVSITKEEITKMHNEFSIALSQRNSANKKLQPTAEAPAE